MTVQQADPGIHDWEVASTHRASGITIKRLFQRDGIGESFEFNVVHFDGDDFFSPRHRHNFDQIRIGLAGEMDYGGKVLRPRMIGYFPEGTHYGPLRVTQPSIQAILQFDGASRCGYVNYVHLDRGTEVLRERGDFRNGFFHPEGAGKAVDAYQAVWEEVSAKPMEYPDPRFAEALYLNVDAFGWVPTADPGVRTKGLVAPGERHTRIDMVELAAGATRVLGEAGRTVLAFVLDGEVTAGDHVLREWSALSLEDDTTQVTGSAERSEIVLITLPDFED